MTWFRMESAAEITGTTRSQINDLGAELDALGHHDRSAQILADGCKALNILRVMSFHLMNACSFIKFRYLS
jgi:hypothetical protein